MSRISAARFSSRLASNILMLTLSTPAAPRFRFTAWKACRMSLGVIRPVSECTLIFFMASLSRSVTTEFGRSSRWGMFLSGLAAFHRFPGKGSGGPILGFSCGANFPHVLVVVLRLRSVSPFYDAPFPTRRYSGSAATLKEEAAKATFSSPTASSERFHQWLIRSTYRPSDGVGLHRS